MAASSTTVNASERIARRARVVIADDHPIVRSGIKAELEAAPDLEVVGEAATGDEALQQVATLGPDVLILDVNMPGIKSRAVLQTLQGAPSPKVLVLTVEQDVECVAAMLKAGALGYLVKDEHPSSIVDGVRAVARGEVWLSKSVLAGLIEHNFGATTPVWKEPVTEREMEVLRLVAHGKYNPQIAEMLQIAEGTVKNHISSLYEKLKVHSRAELVAYAWQHGLVDAD